MSRGKGRQTLQLIEAAAQILEEIQPASVRAVCYRLFIAALIPNMGKNATNAVSRALTAARENGAIPFEWITDESRAAEHVPSWSDPNALVKAAISQYRKDYWQEQPCRIEVWSEKGTVRGTLHPVLHEYGVTFRVMHGYASATVINSIATLSEQLAQLGKHFIALYVGDWDPSGKHMSDVDLQGRLNEYGAQVFVERIALQKDDLAELPSFSVESKLADSRYRWFRENVGTDCYELDAMSPPKLRDRVEEYIRFYLDMDRWQHCRMVERAEIESMQDFHKSWQASICGGRS